MSSDYRITKIDGDIVLECLHETYGMEKDLLFSGQPVAKTMAYPFCKMLESERGLTSTQIHCALWDIYIASKSKDDFIKQAKPSLMPK